MPNYRRANTPGGCYFFTVVTHERRPILANPRSHEVLRDVVRAARRMLPFRINAWVTLPDHIHCIWTLPDADRDFSKRWGLIKAGFSKRWDDASMIAVDHSSRSRHRERTVWQRRFWEHEIRDEDDFGAHLDYIHYNPVRHGYVNHAKDWPHSTFHRYVQQGVYPKDWGGGNREFPLLLEFGE